MKAQIIFLLIIFNFCGGFLIAVNVNRIDQILSMTFEELMEVELVTADKNAQKVKDIPASITIVTQDEITRNGYTTISEILTNVLGLYSVNDLVSRDNYGVRGFWTLEANANIIYLVNGMNQVLCSTGMNLLSTINIPVESILRIEIIRGPMAVKYGNGAFFGVINIITRDYSIDKNNNASYTVFSDNNYNTYIGVAKKSDDIMFSVNLSYRVSSIDKPFNTVIDSLKTKNGSYTTDMGSIEELTKSSDYHFDISVSSKGFYSDLSYDESELNGIAWSPPILDDYCKISDQATRMQFGFRKEIHDRLTIDSKIEFNNIIRKWDFSFNIDDWGIQYLESSRINSEINTFYKFDDKLSFDAGFNYTIDTKSSNYYDIPDWSLYNYYSHTDNEPIKSRGLYLQSKYRLSDSILLEAGIRVDQLLSYPLVSEQGYGTQTSLVNKGSYNETELSYIPRISGIYNINESNILKLMYGEAISRPTFFENHDMLIWTQQKPLKSETIKTVEVNYIANIKNFAMLNLSYFHNCLENLIIRNIGFDENDILYNYRINGGKIETEGIEVQLNINPSKTYHITLNGSIVNSTDKNNEDLTVSYAPKYLSNIKFYADLTDKIGFSINHNYVGKMSTEFSNVPVGGSDSPPIGRIGESTKGYSLVNTNLTYNNFFNKKLRINFRISNLFDSEFYYPTTAYSDWAKKGIIGEGRVFSLRLSYEY